MRRAAARLVFILVVAASLGAVLSTSCAPRVSSPLPATPAPQRSTKLGVHTRLTDEAEAAKIERTLQLVQEMGAGWIVEYFPWAYHEPERGRYEWEHVDQVIGTAERLGLRVVARIDMVPAWARPPESTPKLLPPEQLDNYVAFLARFAARYQGRIEGIIVWNEPNLSFEWGFRPVSAAEYAQMLERAYEAIKSAAPTVRVIAAGLAPTTEQSEQALSDVIYLRELYELGAGDFFDALAAHAYGWQAPPDEPPDPERLNFRRVELLRQLMVQYGDASKPMIITEAGWNDHPRWTRAVRPAQRIEYTLRALEIAEEEWPWAEAVCIWAFRLPTLAHNYNDYYTLVSPEFDVKPIYEAIRDWAQQQAERERTPG